MKMDFQGSLKDDPDHLTNKNLPRTFYLVKLQEFRNPKLVEAEGLLRHQRAILAARREKYKMYKDRMEDSLRWSSNYKGLHGGQMEDLKMLQVSLDKITFANKRSLIKPVRENTPPEEIDNLGLRFGMLHGSNNLADERKILKKMTRLNPRRMNSLPTLEDYDRKIWELQLSLGTMRHDCAMKKQQISRDIMELTLAREAAIENAACNGEIWESLGDKDGLQKKIKITQEDIKAREGRDLGIGVRAARQFEKTAKDLARFDKQLSHTEGIIAGAFKRFCRLSSEYQPANVSLLNDARELAKRKDMASLQSLCEQQIASFMEKWNNDGEFRDDYKRRDSISLNSRGLCPDGRTRIATLLHSGKQRHLMLRSHISAPVPPMSKPDLTTRR